MIEKTVKIKICAEIYDLTDYPGDGPDDISEEYISRYLEGREADFEEEAPDAPSDEPIEMTVEGIFKKDDGGNVTLSYPEPEENGMAGCDTVISFNAAEPDSVTMTRYGAISTALAFDLKNRRQMCSYDTGIIPIEFCICTKNVKNSIGEEGGILLLDYSIEMRGVPTERNRMVIEVYDLFQG